ncbi:MAG: peptide chain release factor 1 [Clostridiales bacterium]|jgi:peptide chain release factor 1|nr:peptide chain release factor 1 [Clostridiales bacterium]
MKDKLDELCVKFKDLTEKISDPEVIADNQTWQKYCKEHKYLEPIITKYNEYTKAVELYNESAELLDDKDLKELAQADYDRAKDDIARLQDEIKILLLPKDPNDDKDVILEIRGGAGGDEAALFAGDLLRMYQMYGERQGWKFEALSLNSTELGGIKEVSIEIKGQDAYSKLKYESGVHRVQRVPTTESSGRIHTSTVTVAVLPVVEDVEVDINPNDLRIDVFRAGGPGGQCVNTTDSAVRITHIPTGLVVSCQDEKSQLKNKDKGMKILRSRLYDLYQSQQHEEIANERKSQVGTGDRSERIRTYNYPQGRVSDHRIGLTLHKLEQIMNGDLDEIITALATHYQAEKLKATTE